jgi:hypothetical protein
VQPWTQRLLEIVEGRATPAMIEGWVDASFQEDRFAVTVPEDFVSGLPSNGRPVKRYGDSGALRSQVCFQHAEGAGGVVVHTPAMPAWSSDRASYCVAPHVHANAHVTVVLRGEAHFFIARGGNGQAGVTQVPVGPGSVLLCPARVAHTFGSRGGPFSVLSMQARFVHPSRPEFARNVSGFERGLFGRSDADQPSSRRREK